MPHDLATLRAELSRNQADIDFAEAVLARGGPDADGMRERLAALEAERSGLLASLDQLEAGAGADAEDALSAAQHGPVEEFTARALFAALHAHAKAVEAQLRWLDEKDAGYRGDAHVRAVLAILDSALE